MTKHWLTNFLLRAPTGLKSRFRVMTLRALGAQIGENCRLGSIEVPRNPWKIHLSEGVALDRGVVLLDVSDEVDRSDRPRIVIGPRSYVNRHTMFDASISITVGCDVLIGPFCYITDHDHASGGIGPRSMLGRQEAAVVIGRNVWLGAGVCVLKGVAIGDNAVIGAGSVLTRDVPAGARVAGVPGRSL